ncbi:MAG TPA: ABC transporter ATP-binding protein [Micromonosporaceae bacterium]|jgi:branched-chain amino acid transport system ATP-binding protein
MTSQSDVLQISGIGVRFGGLVALDDVSLTVAAGQIMGVIGPNGAGKTTLFNVICGFVPPSAGEMSWDGSPLRPKPHQLVSLGIGRTQQAVGLFGGLTVLENVMAGTRSAGGKRARFVGQMFGLPGSDRADRRIRDTAMAHMHALGIDRFAGDLPGPLPFAIQKRVALARALIAEPRLLLLDEPASGLGADEIEELATVIRGLPGRPGRPCSVMLVEHHMDLVMRVCDEITVLNFGRVIARGTPDEIKSSAAVTDAYLGAEVTD